MVFQRNGNAWPWIGFSHIADDTPDFEPWNVALDAAGNTIIFGDNRYEMDGEEDVGLVRVYTFNGSEWLPKGSSLTGVDGNDFFGRSVDISADGNTIAVGATEFMEENGYTRIYTFKNGDWELQTTIDGYSIGNAAGVSVDLTPSAKQVIISGTGDNSEFQNGGVVTVHELDGVSAANQRSEYPIRIFPNPTSAIFQIDSDDLEIRQVILRDGLGRILKSFQGPMRSYDLAQYANGFYLLEIESADQHVMKKIIKR